MGKKIKGWKRRENKILEDFTLVAVPKLVYDYYNTILQFSDHIYTTSILYRVETRWGRKSKTRVGGKEIKSRSTLYTLHWRVSFATDADGEPSNTLKARSRTEVKTDKWLRKIRKSPSRKQMKKAEKS